MTDSFLALADPTRRAILDRLRGDAPLTVTELSSPLDMTRQAVTKHLDVLERAGLVRSERHGRERRHHLVPEPLREVDEWLAPYAAEWDRRLSRLGRHVDGPSTPRKEEEGT